MKRLNMEHDRNINKKINVALLTYHGECSKWVPLHSGNVGTHDVKEHI